MADAMARQLDRRGSFHNLGLAIHQGADPVGSRGRALDLRMNVRQLADRVGSTGQHGVESQQLLDRHDLRGKLDLERAQAEVDRLLEDQVRTRQEGDGDRDQSQHLEDRIGHGVDHRHPDRLAVEVLGLDEEPSPLDAFHGKRLDHPDPLKTLLEDLVDRRHALERPAHGALHDPADANRGHRRDRHDHQGQAGQPPVQVERPAQAEDDSQRFADQLAHERDQPLAERIHVVGEPRHQLGGTLIREAAQVQVERAPEEQVADVELRPLHDVGNQDLLQEHEEALDRHSQDDQADQEEQIAKAVRGQVAVDRRLQLLVPPQPGLLAFLFLSEAGPGDSGSRRDRRLSARRCPV